MDVVNAMDYEYPLPVLDVSLGTNAGAVSGAINIEARDAYTGRIKVKNTGGGTLKGHVISRVQGLTFVPAAWEGNIQEIIYTFAPQDTALSAGQVMDGHIFITSNGGEEEIPVSVKLTKMSLTTSGGFTIANLMDFYKFSQINPTEAKKIFTDSEFYMLLLAMGYEYMEVYESLHKDANRDRAMDNFFILSGIKGQTALRVENPHFEFIQNPMDRAFLHGVIRVKKSDDGFVEAAVAAKSSSSWLTLSANRLSAGDFNGKNEAEITFSINPSQIASKYACETVLIGSESSKESCEIVYRRMHPVTFKLNREAYRYEDNGKLEIVNNTGRTMQVEVFCPESYIRFFARSYAVGEYGEIPFDVKLSAFMSAQLFFRKTPYMETVIEIKASVPGQVFKKTLPLIVGEW